MYLWEIMLKKPKRCNDNIKRGLSMIESKKIIDPKLLTDPLQKVAIYDVINLLTSLENKNNVVIIDYDSDGKPVITGRDPVIEIVINYITKQSSLEDLIKLITDIAQERSSFWVASQIIQSFEIIDFISTNATSAELFALLNIKNIPLFLFHNEKIRNLFFKLPANIILDWIELQDPYMIRLLIPDTTKIIIKICHENQLRRIINNNKFNTLLKLIPKEILIKEKNLFDVNYELTESAENRLKSLEESNNSIQQLAAWEIRAVLSKPYWLDQGNEPVCGIAVFIGLLIEAAPSSFVHLACDVMMEFCFENYDLLNIKESFIEILLSSIRNMMNTFGYSKHFLANVRGVTFPHELCTLLERFGFTEVQEATNLVDANSNELSSIYKFFTHQFIYSEKHKTFKNMEDNFQVLLETFKENKKIVLLLSANLLEIIMDSRQKIEPTCILNIQINHFVLLNQLEIINSETPSDTQVKIQISTWGRQIENQIPIQDFLKGYRGFISAIAPTHDLDYGIEKIPVPTVLCRVM